MLLRQHSTRFVFRQEVVHINAILSEITSHRRNGFLEKKYITMLAQL